MIADAVLHTLRDKFPAVFASPTAKDERSKDAGAPEAGTPGNAPATVPATAPATAPANALTSPPPPSVGPPTNLLPSKTEADK